MSGDAGGDRGPSGTLVAVHIGGRIRARRLEVGLELKDAALDAGLSEAALAAMEMGRSRPTPAQLVLLARRLGVAVTWFFEDIPEAPESSTVERAEVIGTGRAAAVDNAQEHPSDAKSADRRRRE